MIPGSKMVFVHTESLPTEPEEKVISFKNVHLNIILRILSLIGFAKWPQIPSSSSQSSSEFRSTCCTRITAGMLLINSICFYVVGSHVYLLITTADPKVLAVLGHVSEAIVYTSATFCVNILFCKRKKLSELDHMIHDTLSQRSSMIQQQFKCTKIPMFLIISCLCALFIRFAVNFVRFDCFDARTEYYELFAGFGTLNITDCTAKITLNTFLLCVFYFVILFCYCVYALYLVFCQTMLDYLNHFNRQLSMLGNWVGTKNLPLEKVIQDYNGVLATVERFEKCFSTFNLCWMLVHVQRCIYTLTFMLERQQNFANIVETANMLFMFLLLFVFTIRVNEKVKAPLKGMRKLFNKEPNSASNLVVSTQMLLLYQLNEASITAGGFFRINRSFVISLFMGFMSYGVLISQLRE